MDDSGLTEIIWVDDPSFLIFWVEDPTWVGDLEEFVFVLVVGSSRAKLRLLLELRPSIREVPTALGGISAFL